MSRLYTTLFLATCLLKSAAAHAADTPSFADLLPNKTVLAEGYAFDIDPTSSFATVAAAVRKVAQEDPEWFTQHGQNPNPDGSMRYDKRFGVSEEAWNQFRRDSKEGNTGMVLVSIGRAEIQVRTDGNALVYTVNGSKFLGSGMYFYKDTQQFVVPFIGDTKTPTSFTSNNQPLGRLEGLTWKSEGLLDPRPQSLTGKLATITAMKLLDEPGRCAMELKAKKMVSARPVLDEQFILKYPCPKSGTASH